MVLLLSIATSHVGWTQQPPQKNPNISAHPNILWNDGKLAPHSHADGHEGHNHDIDLEAFAATDSPEDKQRKASMTPVQRKEYDRQRASAVRDEAQAREAYFAQVPEGDDSELAKEYISSFGSFRSATIDLVITLNEFSLAHQKTRTEMDVMQEKWLSVIAKCNQTKELWVSRGAALYLSDTNKYERVGKSLKEMLIFDANLDRFDGWNKTAAMLLASNSPIVDEEFAVSALMTSLANNEFDASISAIEELSKKGILKQQSETYMQQLAQLKVNWESEKKFREEDASKSNPRIEFITSKGRIVIELFEDDAPDATSSMIYLVEKGFYTRKAFFRVEQHSVIQTGCEKGDGTGDAGYTIHQSMNKRKHLRGSCALALGMTKGVADLDSGSSQFFIDMMPLNHLDDNYAVFGRVVEGLEILGLLKRMNLSLEEERKENKTPDFIISAKVLNKRDHAYTPTPVRGKLYR